MTDTTSLQPGGFLRLPAILKLIPIGRSTWWAGVRSGRFPQPVKLGKHTTAWKVEDIQALMNAFRAAQRTDSAAVPTQKVNMGARAIPPVQDAPASATRAPEWVNRVTK